MPQNQWTQPPQRWRPQSFQQATLLPLPPQPNNITQNNVPPKQPQLPSQPAPNPNNKKVQPMYNNDTNYKKYALEL
jgi:hypothetical protein